MIKFEKIKSGMILFDVRRNNKGFPRGNNWLIWPVKIIEVYEEKRQVLASWNYNRCEIMTERRVTKFRAKKPK